MKRVLSRCVVFAALWLAIPSFGQTFGEITGVVTDSSGAVLVRATVTVTNPQTNASRSVTTNNTGNYAFPALLPGVYNVRAEMTGFQPEVHTRFELQVQQTARIDFQLRVGTATEAVEVKGGAALLSTENATVGIVIENRRIAELPLNGRNFLSLIALSPNVTARRPGPLRLGVRRVTQCGTFVLDLRRGWRPASVGVIPGP